MGAENVVGSIPEFTTDETPVVPQPEEAAPGAATVVPEAEAPGAPEGTETPAVPSPANGPTAEELAEIQKQRDGLLSEKAKLLDEVKSLRGTRREIKQEQISKVEKQIDDLQDLNPADVSVVERILRTKGYIRQEEASKMFYESVKQEKVNSFLERYPEYKPENDPNDINWAALQRELGYYKMPTDPHQLTEVLERAHKALVKPTSTHTQQIKKQQVAVASHGSGGVSRPSAPAQTKVLTATQRDSLIRGGWTEEDLKRIENS